MPLSCINWVTRAWTSALNAWILSMLSYNLTNMAPAARSVLKWPTKDWTYAELMILRASSFDTNLANVLIVFNLEV